VNLGFGPREAARPSFPWPPEDHVQPNSARQLAAESHAVDRELMLRVRARDPEALRALYDRHANLVYGLGRRVLRDPSEAADLVQDVFLHLWRRADLFDGDRGYFAGWLVSLARNRAIDRLRARRTRERKVDEYESVLAVDPASRGPAPDESAYAGELRGAVVRALSTLPEAQRTALELAYFGGFSHSEIAERLETPLGTVKARIRQGMLRLRELLGDFVDAGLASGTEEGSR
jgi:RNA polymerase sigma-70 factor (ECF subfamily)